MGITCVRCGVSFTTNLLHFTSLHTPMPLPTCVRPRTWVEIFTASAPTPPLVQSRTEVDFPMTPRPMRVETASDGDFLTPDKKDIKERQAGEGWSSWGSRVLVLAGSSGRGSSSSLIFSLVLVDWCVAGWRARSLVLGAATKVWVRVPPEPACLDQTARGGKVPDRILTLSSPSLPS